MAEDSSLTGVFSGADDAPDSSPVPAVFADKKIAIGSVVVLEDVRLEPSEAQKSERYGMDPAAWDALDEGTQERVRKGYVEAEIKRYEIARLSTIKTYKGYLESAETQGLIEVKDIAVESLKAELMMVESKGTQNAIISKINNGFSAEAAVDEIYEEKISRFRDMPNQPNVQRKIMVEFAQHRSVLQQYLDDPEKTLTSLHNLAPGTVIVASSLPLHALSHLIEPRTGALKIAGVIVDEGSMQSHAAILCQAKGIPYAHVSGRDMEQMKSGDSVIMDGTTGTVHLHAGPKMRALYEEKFLGQTQQAAELMDRWSDNKRVETQDEHKVNVHANFALSLEAAAVQGANPVGIGLYRTEIAAHIRDEQGGTLPEKWAEIFRENMRLCDRNGKAIGITIRTIDLEGDKSDLPPEERAAKQREITFGQMNGIALLRRQLDNEGIDNRLKVMIPMIKSPVHLQEMQSLMNAQCDKQGIQPIKLGAMIETLEVLKDLDRLDAGFFSVGTNDLLYAILRVDRYDGDTAIEAYDPTNPEFLGALKDVADAAHKRAIPASICGNMASEVRFLPLLIGAGFRNFSVGTDAIPMVKELSSRIDTRAAQQLFEKVRDTEDRAAREAILARFNEENLGLRKDGSLDAQWHPPVPGESLRL